ncbi:MBL fold metallo-hydrolase [Roseospira navarrensis]|uniref:MBL fold metallo-hydrolase n=1 Tax=Roseospira navarrensis TaxID=140058 RepID=A0A7X1ZIC9_9PROT|nr:MBL fold metallo-hydrolase [Roseospira navarrensis]MQX37997.1 MBL fold metallo-hydrolase [Roseospira navarrensis]
MTRSAAPLRRFALGLVMACGALPALAGPLEVQRVTDGVYALVGPMAQRDPDNLGNNATFGLIVTDSGAVLIDPGGSRAGAAMIDAAIDTVTDQPVRTVINTGGQDHRWLGNGYWVDQGATVIASADAVADQRTRGSVQLSMLRQLIGDGLDGTEPVHAGTVFEDAHTVSLGGVTLQIHHPGPAHTPGDSYVWVPQKDTVFTGDIVYVGRLLGVMDHSHAGAWIDAFDAVAALDPGHVVPGHGPATTLDRARADTRDYLVHLRRIVRDHMDAGGSITEVGDLDQSAFSHLLQFEALAGRNAQQVCTELEWE